MIFVMDATIGQACESQVNNTLIDLWFVRDTWYINGTHIQCHYMHFVITLSLSLVY